MKFLRRNWSRHSKLGKRRKNKQIWRKPKGRHNKMRQKERGYSATVKVGYQKDRKNQNKLLGKNPVMVMNVKDLGKIGKNDIAIVGKIGIKKKLEIAKVAKEKKISIFNMNPEKFLDKNSPKKDRNKTEENKK